MNYYNDRCYFARNLVPHQFGMENRDINELSILAFLWFVSMDFNFAKW